MAEKLIDLKAFKGLRNNVVDERFELGDLVVGSNVYINDTGQVTRRGGFVKVFNGTPRSLWSDGDQAYFAEGTSLKRLYPDFTTATVGSTGSSTAPLEFLKVNDRVYWSDEVATGVIDGGVSREWGLTPPTTVLVAATAGGLPVGSYGATSTYVRADGQESGAKAMAVAYGSGLSITFTDSPPADATLRRLYVTSTDGDMPFLVGEYPAATGSVQYLSDARTTLPLRTLFCGPPPAGSILAECYGRVLVAKGKHLFITLPFNFELVDYRSGFVSFDDDITIVAPVNGGVYVATTKTTYFLAGTSPETWQKTTVAAYGGVKGTRTEAVGGFIGKGVGGRAQVWTAAEGIVVGTDNGNFVNLTLDRYIPVAAQSGTGFVRGVDGAYFFVTNLYF